MGVIAALTVLNTGCDEPADTEVRATGDTAHDLAPVMPISEDGERAKFKGVWELVRATRLGSLMSSADHVGHRYEFNGEQFRVTRRSDGVGPWRTYRLDVDATPMQITGLVAGPGLRTQTDGRKGIYRFDGDKLRVGLAYGASETPPASFISTADGPDFESLTLARVCPLPADASVGKTDSAAEGRARERAFYRLQPCVSSRNANGKYDVDFHRLSWSRAIPSFQWQRLIDLYEIRHLKLRSCSYVGDQEAGIIGRLTPIEQLDLHATDVTDDGMIKLAALANLRHLDLSMTAVTDVGLAAISRMEGLQTLILSGSAVTQPGIAELRAKRPSLDVVWTRSYTDSQRRAVIALSRHELEIDDVPDPRLDSYATTCRVTVSPFTEIRTLSAAGDEVEVRQPSPGHYGCFDAATLSRYFANVPAPTVVVVHDSSMDDSVFAAIRDIPGLVRLSLERTEITDAGLSDLKLHQELRILHLDSAGRLTDKGVAELAALRNLEELWIEGIDLTPAGIEPLLQLDSLRRLNVDREALTHELSAKFTQNGVKVRRR